MRMKHHLFALSLALLVGTATAVHAQNIPPGFNYQGSLFDPNANLNLGGPVTGLQQIVFRLYDAGTGGNLKWARQIPVFLNDTGKFNIVISDAGSLVAGAPTSTLLSVFSANSSLYMGVQVLSNGTEITPYQQIITAPYALKAETAQTAVTADYTVGALSAQAAPIVLGGGIGGFTIEQIPGGGILRLDPVAIESPGDLLLNTYRTNATILGGNVRYTGSCFGPLVTLPAGSFVTVTNDGFVLCAVRAMNANINADNGAELYLAHESNNTATDEGCFTVPIRRGTGFSTSSGGDNVNTWSRFYFRAIGP